MQSIQSTGAGKQKRYLRARPAADYVGLSSSTMAKMRLRGDGPAYSKAGQRTVVYDVIDLDKWLAASKRRSTSDRESSRT